MIDVAVFLLIGIIFLLLSFHFTRKYKYLQRYGRETEGVIFDEEQSNRKSSGSLSTPIVRFVTADKVWITAKSNFSFMPGFYKLGQHVIVIYDEKEPSAFFIKSKGITALLLLFGFIGFVSLVIGSYMLLVKMIS